MLCARIRIDFKILIFLYLTYFFGLYKGLSFTWVVVFVPGQDGDFPSVCLPQVQQHHHKTGTVYWAQCFHYSIGSLTEHNLKKEIKKWHDRNLSDIINGQPKRVKIPYPWSLLCLWLSLVNLTNSPFDNVHVCANLTTENIRVKKFYRNLQSQLFRQ